VDIFWYGHSCFRIRSSSGFVVLDPYGKELGRPLGRPTADLVTVSHDHAGHNNVKAIKGKPFVVDGPGEYEVKGIFVVGVRTAHDGRKGEERGLNTAYCISVDGITVCHLGDLGHRPTQAQVEKIGDIDVLMIPVGGSSTVGAALAAEIVSLLDASIVIPMHFRSEARQDLDPVDKFLKEVGAGETEPLEMLRVFEGRFPEEPQVVVLEPKA
jgi:L-ascorbate metabolism protein UlaG (beta-lactamase superfamily)